MSKDLNPEKALIFRIVHRDNISEILSDGWHCRSSKAKAKYVEIGNAELIVKRASRLVPCGPGGTLSDYVPFYFTPYSPMLLNIKTGFNGVTKRPMNEIIILVSSLHFLKKKNIPFIFSDRHAYLKTALFSEDLADLNRIIWTTLQEKNFRKDDLERFEKYQAEALIYKHVPLTAILGAVCYDAVATSALKADIKAMGLSLNVIAQPKWYL